MEVPTQEGGPPNPAPALPSLTGPHTTQDQGSKSEAVACTRAPHTCSPPCSLSDASGEHSQPGRNSGPHSLGSLAAQLTQNDGQGACFLKLPSFTRYAGDPGKCCPHMEHLLTANHLGGFHLESRKILHTVSMATGLSEQSASSGACEPGGGACEPGVRGPERGLVCHLPTSLRPAMALTK